MTAFNPMTSIMAIETIPDNIHHIPIERLGNELKQQALTFALARQKQFLMGRILLAELLYQQHGITQLPPMTYQNNKPLFKEIKYGHFNISHSANYIAVILSAEPIGLDIEKIEARSNHQKIARYCFSDVENRWLVQQPNTLFAFLQLWTQREAILKLHGKGVWQMKQIALDLEKSTIYSHLNNDIFCINGAISECMLTIAQHHARPLPTLVHTPWSKTKNQESLNNVILSSTLNSNNH